MSIPGTKNSLIVVADTDSLIAVLHEEDKNHQRAVDIVNQLLQDDCQVVFPLTSIVETITTLRRKLNQPRLAASVIKQITSGTLAIENTDTDLLKIALTMFDPKGSKRNTLFDALVAALAKRMKTEIIFSFDSWYTKLGFRLAGNLSTEQDHSITD